MESVLGIIGIFFVPFIMVILIVWFSINERNKRSKLQAELYGKAIEKGQEIPTDLFALTTKKKSPLNTGIICIAMGIGISLFLAIVTDPEDTMKGASLGIIPFVVGIGYLIIYFIEKKHGANENTQ